jgi:hypothetical protein
VTPSELSKQANEVACQVHVLASRVGAFSQALEERGAKIAELRHVCARLSMELAHAGRVVVRHGHFNRANAQRIADTLNLECASRDGKREYYVTDDGQLSYRNKE